MGLVASMSSKEFERLAVLHSMGALTPEEADRFRAERRARGEDGERLVKGAEDAVARVGAGSGTRSAPAERAALTEVTGRPLRRKRPRAPWAVAVILLLGVAAAVAWALTLRDENLTLESRRAAEARTVDSLRSVLATRDSVAEARPAIGELAPALAADDLVAVELSGESDARGRLLATAEAGAILVAREVPPLPPGLEYRLWRSGPTGLDGVTGLGGAHDGFLFAVFSDVEFLLEATGVLITVEDVGEGTSPSSEPILQGVIGPP
jgi:hypothetical protein